MKYIIEIKTEYEGTTKGIIVLGIKNNCLCVDELAIEELEELNADYINNHFPDIRKKVDEAYQRGLDDAWEAAKKIADMWTRIGNDELLAIFGITERIGHSTIRSLFEKQTANEAMLELEAYEEKQKEEDEIKVGDELEHTVSGYTSKAIFLEKIKDDEDWYKCLFWTGCGVTILTYPKRQFKRTGRHFDIDRIRQDTGGDAP